MKNNFLKILGLVLSLGITASNLPSVSAGGRFSKPKISEQERRAAEICSNYIKYSPIYADDGGLTYFWAWNGCRMEEHFNAFVEKYSSKSDSTTSAKMLSDSIQDEDWMTLNGWGNSHTLESFERIKDSDLTKYLLRIDTEKNLIYTVRKSGDLYLFTFYLACGYADHDTNPTVSLCCFAVSSNMRNIKNILLPIDQALFD